jgi:hypothetical protein
MPGHFALRTVTTMKKIQKYTCKDELECTVRLTLRGFLAAIVLSIFSLCIGICRPGKTLFPKSGLGASIHSG